MFAVVNSNFPELTQLAAEFAARELLSIYVRPFTSLGRSPARVLARVPVLGPPTARLLERRTLAEEFEPRLVVQAALGYDLAQALIARSRLPLALRRPLTQGLIYRRDRAIGRSARRQLGQETGIIASWGTAAPVFAGAKVRGNLPILNYSLAHHSFTRKYLEEEAGLRPDFASSLNSHDLPHWLMQQLDFEVASAELILVGSSFARDTFLAQGVSPSKLEVVPYGVSLEAFTPPESETDRKGMHALFVGQVSQRKGISYLLEAARLGLGPEDSLTLIGDITGDGRFLERYSRIVEWHPRMPHARLREYYRRADVFVFPTLVEGMPLVVLEAMASGLPVITTPNGPGDIVRDGIDGFIVPPRDVAAIVDRLDILRRDRELRSAMGASARGRASEFTWSNYRKRAVNVIRQRTSGA